jgi:Ca-activated chloride channel family protein
MFGWDFASGWAFYLFLLLPIAAWGVFWRSRRHVGSFTFGNTLALREVRGNWLGSIWWLPGALRLGALTLLVIALARPQKPNRRVVTTEGVDVVIALDMSASMNAVDKSRDEIEDIQVRKAEDPANRFELAQELLVNFIKGRAENGDRVGLILFGMGAYLKYPLTTDYRRAIRDIRSLKLDDGRRNSDDMEACLNDCTISGAMTTIGDALRRGFLRLRDSKARDRSIILITDGDDRGSKMGPKYVAEYIRDWGRQVNAETGKPNRPIRVYPFLIGGGQHTYMPDTAPFTNRLRKTNSGLTVYRPVTGQFPVNPDLLAEIANLTGGKSFHSYDEEAFREAFADLEKTVYKRTVTNFPDERFMAFAWWAMLLLLAEFMLRLTVLRKFP